MTIAMMIPIAERIADLCDHGFTSCHQYAFRQKLQRGDFGQCRDRHDWDDVMTSSFYLDTPPGATITLVFIALFLVINLIKRIVIPRATKTAPQ